MSSFYRATLAEPSDRELVDLFNNSTRDQWLYDEESKTFTFQENMNLFVVLNDRGLFELRYGYMHLAELTESDMKLHLPAIAEPPHYA